jgi:hypothetical protein
MKHPFLAIVIFSFGLLLGCVSRSHNNNGDYTGSSQQIYYESSDETSDQDGYADGTYCATIEYYYSVTGKRSTYTLKVEIEDNELTIIHWPNGGWLDNTHFSPPDISDGTATFTSDRGAEYSIEIIGEEDDCGLSGYVEEEEDVEDVEEEGEEEEEEGEEEDDEF